MHMFFKNIIAKSVSYLFYISLKGEQITNALCPSIVNYLQLHHKEFPYIYTYIYTYNNCTGYPTYTPRGAPHQLLLCSSVLKLSPRHITVSAAAVACAPSQRPPRRYYRGPVYWSVYTIQYTSQKSVWETALIKAVVGNFGGATLQCNNYNTY